MMLVPPEPPLAPLPPPPLGAAPPVPGWPVPAVPPSVMAPGPPSSFGAPPHATAMATAIEPYRASRRFVWLSNIGKLQCPGERARGGTAHGALGTLLMEWRFPAPVAQI